MTTININGLKELKQQSADFFNLKESINKSISLEENYIKNNYNLSKDFLCDDFYISLLLNNRDIYIKNNNFKSKNNELNKELNLIIENTKIIHLDGFENRAFIIDNNGFKTLILKEEIGSQDMFKLKGLLTKMNVKPNNIFGFEDNCIHYKEHIDPKINILKNEKPNSTIAFLSMLTLSYLGFQINSKIKLKKERLKKYLKRKKMLKSMSIDTDDDEELSSFEKELHEKEKYFLKLSDSERIKQMKNHILKTMSQSDLPDNIISNINNNLINGKYDNILIESYNPSIALSDLIISEFDGNKYIHVLENMFKPLQTKFNYVNK